MADLGVNQRYIRSDFNAAIACQFQLAILSCILKNLVPLRAWIVIARDTQSSAGCPLPASIERLIEMRTFMVILTLASSAAYATTNDWRIINWNDDILLYVDHDSIRNVRSVASYTSKIVFLKDDNLAEVISRVQVRCDERLYRNVSVAAVSKAGREETQKASRQWRPVAPGTNVEREVQNVCK